MKFELTKEEEEKLNKWLKSIKTKHGEYGLLTYKFTPYGIGTGVTVYSHLTGGEIDLTDTDKW